MKIRHLLGILLGLAIIPLLSSCGNETLIDGDHIYTNHLVLHGDLDVFVISNVVEETAETVSIKLFEPYDDIITGTLIIPKYSVGKTLDISEDNSCVKLSYKEKGKEEAELRLASGTMNVKYGSYYCIRINAVDENGARFFLEITVDVFHQNDEGQWVG